MSATIASENLRSETMESINMYALIPTAICFLIGLAYYYYKYRNVREHLHRGNLGNNFSRQRPPSQNNSSFNNREEEPNLNSSEANHNGHLIKVYILIQNERKEFYIDKNQNIGNFVKNILIRSIREYNSNQTIYLICQGRRLNERDTFSDYSAISDNTVIHCFITSQSNSSQRETVSSNIQREETLINDENAVSIYTLFVHFIILLIVAFLIMCYKTIEDSFSRGALIAFQLMVFFWVTELSKCIAKVIIHKKIIYN